MSFLAKTAARFSAPLRLFAVLLCLVGGGCTRAFYRQQADGDVYCLLDAGKQDPRWDLNRITIQPNPGSRFYDPFCPDHTPMPADDPVAHQLMHCVDCKAGWPCWHRNGDIFSVENAAWQAMLPYDAEGNVVLDMPAVMQLAAINSREYQSALESLYLSALDVTFERFRFDTQFFAGNDTFFTTDGRSRAGSGGRSRSTLRTDTGLAVNRLTTTGGEFAAGLANTLMWQFSSDNTYTANTLLDFSFVQPLLQFGGRRRVLERLTLSERNLLGNIRVMQRYRQGFALQLTTGTGATPAPSRQGGVFGGSGLEGFSGVGGGGFGQVGTATGGGGGGAGFAGGAGAAQAGGFLGLLQDAREIQNRRANVAGLRESLELLEALYKAGRIDRLQVDQARQSLFTAQSQLITTEAAYQTAQDAYKIVLGMPPDIPIKPEDDRLDQFELLSPDMLKLQTDAGLMVARLYSPKIDEGQVAPPVTDQPEMAPEQLQLHRDEELLDSALDLVKLAQFLVPPDPQNPRRVLRERGKLYEGRLESIKQYQQRIAKLQTDSENFPHALQEANPIQRRAQELLPGVEESLNTLEKQKQERIDSLQALAERDAVKDGSVDKRAVSATEFEERIRNLPIDFALIKQRIDAPLERWAKARAELQRRRAVAADLRQRLMAQIDPLRPLLEKLRAEIAKPNQANLPPEIDDFIAQLNRLVDDPTMALAQIERGVQEMEVELDKVAQEVSQLSEDAANMGLIQARARLDASGLVPVDLEATQAIEIARENRLDWMNARASLVNSWRLIEFNANALESNLNIVFNGDINTLGDNPFRFRSPTGRLQAGLQFDAPITRLSERNTYRQALIEYQQARRGYMNFGDGLYLSLRNTLRILELNQLNFEMRRSALHVALNQVELARLRLQEPPRPGAPAALGATTARDLVSALGDLLTVQNDYISVWVNYEVQRMQLDVSLGTMMLDDRGMWIDPGPVDGKKLYSGQAENFDEAPCPEELFPAPTPEDRAEAGELPPGPGRPRSDAGAPGTFSPDAGAEELLEPALPGPRAGREADEVPNKPLGLRLIVPASDSKPMPKNDGWKPAKGQPL